MLQAYREFKNLYYRAIYEGETDELDFYKEQIVKSVK